jgi:HD-GYP domain-containing protein (c-di-GMP phosphodiesterase class II)
MAIRKNTAPGRLRLRRAQRDRAESALRDLEQAHEVTVTALAAALELRDDETGGHAQRVTALALELAGAAAPDLAADPELRYGFLLHDIGKIGIPDAILLKPMQLTPAEKRQMEFHTTLGEQLISGVPHLQGVAREVIAFHHERWDGTGYPWGLAGEAIPLAARIFAVADAFDAISNDRPYQRASSVDAALEKISANAGTQFDPGLVEAFVPLVQQQFARLRVA